MNTNMLLKMLTSFWWIKDKLLNMWISPSELQNVDFNDLNSLNDFAARIMPWILKSNPQVAKQIKYNNLLDEITQRQVSNVIDWL
jgi:hypothetical protein